MTFPYGLLPKLFGGTVEDKSLLGISLYETSVVAGGDHGGMWGGKLRSYFSHLPINSKSRRFLSRVQTGALSPRFFSALLPVGGLMPQKALKIEKKHT